MAATWTVRWAGETISAPSAFDLLATVGERSWAPADAKYPKRGIAHRVWVQNNVLIDPDTPDEAFLLLLAENGILSLTVSGDAPRDALRETLEISTAFHATGETQTSPQSEAQSSVKDDGQGFIDGATI